MSYRFVIISLIFGGVILGLVHVSADAAQHSPLEKSTLTGPDSPSTRDWHNLWLKSEQFFNKTFSSQPRRQLNHNNNRLRQMTVDKVSASATKKFTASNLHVLPYNPLDTEHVESIASKLTYIYISENMSNDVIRCELRRGNISECETVLNNLFGPQQMFIISNRLYVVNYSQPLLYSCGLTGNGEIESCSQTVLPINEPAYIIYDNYSFYITDLALKKTSQCNLDYDFLILNCNQVATIVNPTLNNTSYQLFNTAKYRIYTYFVFYNALNYSLTIDKCVESNCSALHDPNLTGPNSISILNNIAYITDGSTNNLVVCNIQANGDFAPCRVLKSGLRTPVGGAVFYFPRS